MSFFRNIRSSLASSTGRGKSSSRDSTPVRSSRPASVISTATSSRRDSIGSSTLQRGDTFILNGSDEEQRQQQQQQHSNSSTLEKKSKKSKVFSKFSTFTKRKKTPSPEEVASYEHHPSDTATNTYYKWKSDGDRMLDYDAQADPFNFLYEQQSSLKALQTTEPTVHRQASIGSNSSGSASASASFDSSTYRKSKTPTHLREQLEQLKTHSNDDLLEQQEEDEREKYKTVTLNSYRKSFRERLLQQQKQAPHNPAWFVEVAASPAAQQSQRCESKENRPDFFVFENENYRPQSRSPLRERPSRVTTRSPVKRNETFRVAQPMLRHSSPSPTPTPATAPSIRIEIKNAIAPRQPGRLVPVGVAKPMPTTEYYAQRLLASNTARQAATASHNNNNNNNNNSSKWYRTQASPTRLSNVQQSSQQSSGYAPSTGRYQTLVQIGNEQNKSTAVLPARGRAPTRVQLYGNKPSSGVAAAAAAVASTGGHKQKPHATYFGDHVQQRNNAHNAHYHAPVNKPRAYAGAMSAISGGVPTIYLGRREQQQQQHQQHQPQLARPLPRRNRSPIKIPWR